MPRLTEEVIAERPTPQRELEEARMAFETAMATPPVEATAPAREPKPETKPKPDEYGLYFAQHGECANEHPIGKIRSGYDVFSPLVVLVRHPDGGYVKNPSVGCFDPKEGPVERGRSFACRIRGLSPEIHSEWVGEVLKEGSEEGIPRPPGAFLPKAVMTLNNDQAFEEKNDDSGDFLWIRKTPTGYTTKHSKWSDTAGNAGKRDDALVVDLEEMWSTGGGQCTYEKLPSPPWSFEPPKRIELEFNGHIIKLMQQAPKHEMVRGWIFKVFGVFPPETIETYEQLEAWVETAKKPEPPKAKPSLEVSVELSRTISGRQRYYAKESAEEEFLLEPEALEQMARESVEAGGNVEELKVRVERFVKNNIWDNRDVDWEEVDRDTGDDDGGESDDYACRISDNVVEMIKPWLQENAPDLAKQLGIG